MNQIPVLPNIYDQAFTCALNGVAYDFQIIWNAYEGYFSLTLSDTHTQSKLFDSLPLLLGVPICGHLNLNIGEFMLSDDGGTGADATFANLGVDVNLYWISPEEMATGVLT